MRLRRLTGLERDKIQSEYDELIALIADLADILAKPERVIAIIKEELDEVKRKFADDRRTELMVGEERVHREAFCLLLYRRASGLCWL